MVNSGNNSSFKNAGCFFFEIFAKISTKDWAKIDLSYFGCFFFDGFFFNSFLDNCFFSRSVYFFLVNIALAAGLVNN
ncbi:MAG: hypothetical protein EB010_14130 [Acidimicrobiia bacterium]|nr:hypothetical protein [Acidimicrobiia bacterium]NDD97987.1 hypothetical protein [Actinomycetota bacterium]NDE60520.1 hypothetical protein [Acidimicrobiia bacterium]